jgi:hypothetical protein
MDADVRSVQGDVSTKDGAEDVIRKVKEAVPVVGRCKPSRVFG